LSAPPSPGATALDAGIRALLRCPACGSELRAQDARFECARAECGRVFPVVRGVPILIDESTSLLRLADYTGGAERVLDAPPGGGPSGLRRFAQGVYDRLPHPTVTHVSRENYDRFTKLLLARGPHTRVLVVGGREAGRGMQAVLENGAIGLVETDIDFGPRTQLVCDAHQLPFAADSFDGVVIQAVLEHVLDPYRCVEEIHRVLAPGGLVYAETPFMYRRHAGPFDFTRFTFLGHRRLFRRFDEVAAGVSVGPAVALALSYTGFLLCFTTWRPLRAALRVFGRLTSFWLKYFDRFLTKNDAALDSAAGFYFLGRRSESVLPDRELIARFRGMG
jgi:SAM-dependent methyltransferase